MAVAFRSSPGRSWFFFKANALLDRALRAFHVIRKLMSLLARLLKPILPKTLSSRPNPICSLRWVYTRSRQRNVTRSPTGDDLLHVLGLHLRKGHSEYAFARFNHAFGSRKFGYTHRFKIYQKAIYMFLYHRNIEGAVAIYSRMRHEGFLPPVGLRAVMDSLLVITKSPSEEAVLEALANAFSLGRARELHLRIVVRLLSPVISINSNMLDLMVEVFLRAQAEGFMLSDRTKRFIARQHHIRGSFQHAQRWLVSMCGRRRADAILMANVRVQPPSDLTQTVGPSVDSLNTLLATQFAHNRNEGAFEIYRLWRSEYPQTYPNTLTFMMLFRALHQGRTAKPRSFRTRRLKNVVPEPTSIPTPRKLFYDMSWCHFSKMAVPTPKFPSKRGAPSLSPLTPSQLQDPTPIVSFSLLTLAFKILTSERDYAGAFVCLRTFKLLNFRIRIPLYRITIGSIVRRIQSELPWLHTRPDIQWYWSYRFLGRPPLPIEFDIHLLEGIIRMGEKKEIALERVYPRTAYDTDHPPVQLKGSLPLSGFAAINHPPPTLPDIEPIETKSTPPPTFEESSSPESQKRLNIPSALEVISAVQPSREDWDFLPLARLLRRAILAAIPEVTTTAAREVCSIIGDAKAEMVPPSYSYKPKRENGKPRTWKKKTRKGV